MIMSGNQFKIINNKINYLLQLQANTRGRNFVTGVEMEYLFKSQENRLQSLVKISDQKQVERLVVHSKSFNYKIQKLRDVANERHYLIMEQVTKMKESVDLKVTELKSKMAIEVENM